MSPILAASLDVLQCPLTGEPLELLDGPACAEINFAAAAGRWRCADGRALSVPLSEGLRTRSGRVVYRVERDVACLLPHLALVPSDGAIQAEGLRDEKRQVQEFYDDFGWKKTPAGRFNDTEAFTAVRPAARDYQRRCNARITRWLRDGGRFILDVASGPIPHPEYLGLSRGFGARICVDFSIRALLEARERLGERGIYVLGDITRLPLADSSIAAVISLHTIYHLPEEEQVRAVRELQRVAKPGAPAVIVYVWSHSALMAGLGRLRGLVRMFKRRSWRTPGCSGAVAPAGNAPAEAAHPLFFRPRDYRWYRREIASRHSARLRVWSAVDTGFQDRFFTEGGGGRLLARCVAGFEDAFPRLCGRFGQYPMFILRKPGP